MLTGRPVELQPAIDALMGTHPQGTSVEALRDYLTAAGLSVGWGWCAGPLMADEIAAAALAGRYTIPLIWGEWTHTVTHFVLCYGSASGRVYVADSLRGLVEYPEADFETRWVPVTRFGDLCPYLTVGLKA